MTQVVRSLGFGFPGGGTSPSNSRGAFRAGTGCAKLEDIHAEHVALVEAVLTRDVKSAKAKLKANLI